MRDHALVALAVTFGLVAGGCAGCGDEPPEAPDAGGMPCTPGVPGQCTGGQVCGTDATCACPPYRTLCDGVCIPTSVDAANCGGCGITCTGNLACSAGQCSATCLPGQTACANACTDVRVDEANCGACAHACGVGTGCVQGNCVATVPVTEPPAGQCDGGGPPVNVNETQCGSDVAATTFRFALCSCSDLDQGTRVLTDGYDSTMGPYVPGGAGGGIGINGNFTLQQTSDRWASGFTVDVFGSVWASGLGGVDSQSAMAAREELHVAGGVSAQARLEVTRDAYIGGDIEAQPGPVAITGELHQPGAGRREGAVTYGTLVAEPVVVGAPCECGAQRIPVAAMVAARASSNDNGAIGLDPAALTQANAAQHLALPCGRYYLDAIDTTRDLTITASGRTALFIGGSVRATARFQLWLEPGAELDVLIAGELTAPNGLDLGSPNYPALSRTYIGGSQMITVTNNANIAGNFYAAYAPVRWQSPTEVFGAVYAGSFDGLTDVQIHYDRAVLEPTCPPPYACSDCTDCQNQACIGGMCGRCMTDADCCAPLTCNPSTGECSPIVN